MVSGKEVMTLTLARGLKRSGKAVHVLTSTWNDGDFVGRLTKDGLSQSQLPLGFISATLRWDCIRMTAEQLWRWPGLVWKYSRLLRRLRPRRVIHTNWHHVLLLWPLLRTDRDVFWFHEIVPDVWHYRLLFSKLALRVESFVAVSNAVERSLIRSGVSPEKVMVIHNGIAGLHAGPVTNARIGGATSIGIVGQIGEWKGHDDLLEAFSLVAARHAALSLGIFGKGDGIYIDRLKARIAELGLEERVKWYGFVKDRASIYESMDLCIVPSRFEEPLSITAIEASYCGCPVIATNRGGLPEVVEDGVTGLLVSARAPRELAAAIDRLVSDPDLRSTMGRSAQARVRRLFSERRFVDEFLNTLFDDIQATSRP
jgi:glycosyltransferase involved in cell wall biosynthesis